jgi:hypothetical protein
MALFKVTVTEFIQRRLTAYVEAPNADAADRWASQSEDFEAFAHDVIEDNNDGSVDRIEPVSEAPKNARIVSVQ